MKNIAININEKYSKVILAKIIHFFHKVNSFTWKIEGEIPSGQKIIGVWHEDIPTLLKFLSHQNFGAQVSQSKDGDILNYCFIKNGFTTFRGSSSRGFHSLRSCLKFLKNGYSFAMALDGPKGPRRKIQAGSPWLAHSNSTPLYIVECQYSSCFRLRTWDKMAWPLPFSKIQLKFSLYTLDEAKF